MRGLVPEEWISRCNVEALDGGVFIEIILTNCTGHHATDSLNNIKVGSPGYEYSLIIPFRKIKSSKFLTIFPLFVKDMCMFLRLTQAHLFSLCTNKTNPSIMDRSMTTSFWYNGHHRD